MRTKLRMHFSKLFCVIAAGVLVMTLGLFPTQTVSASSILGTITHPGFLPRALALDETRNRLFVFDKSNSRIYIYNASTLQELGSIPTSLADSLSLVVDESAGKLYAGFFGPGVSVANGIAVIDIPNAKLLKYLPSSGYVNLVKDEDRNLVYASDNLGVMKIDVSSDTQTTVPGIKGNIYTSMAVNPVTHELFVANWSQNNDNLFIVNPTTLHVDSIPNMVGLGVAVNWTENKAYVTYCISAGYEGVCIYDRDTGTINRIHTTNDSSEPLVFNPLVNRLYSDTEVNAIATIFNGSTDAFTNIPMKSGLVAVGVRNSTDHVYYVGPSGTYMMDGGTGQVVSEFPGGASCSVCRSTVVVNQTSGRVYLINETTAGVVIVIQDGFDKDTVGVFRPSNGVIFLKNSNTTGVADISINYGIGGDYPITGDWDGNGVDTIGVYRNGTFYLRNENTVGIADVYFAFGSPGDQPIAGDWNGDGKDTIGVYRSSTFTFYLRNSNTAGTPDYVFQLGIPGDIGIAGDWNGDGKDTVGVFRPSNGVIFLKNQNSTGTADIAINYGIGGDKPITGDWNNDGIDTIGVLRGNVFYLRNSNTVGYADISFALGIPGDMPIAGNWDGKP